MLKLLSGMRIFNMAERMWRRFSKVGSQKGPKDTNTWWKKFRS